MRCLALAGMEESPRDPGECVPNLGRRPAPLRHMKIRRRGRPDPTRRRHARNTPRTDGPRVRQRRRKRHGLPTTRSKRVTSRRKCRARRLAAGVPARLLPLVEARETVWTRTDGADRTHAVHRSKGAFPPRQGLHYPGAEGAFTLASSSTRSRSRTSSASWSRPDASPGEQDQALTRTRG